MAATATAQSVRRGGPDQVAATPPRQTRFALDYWKAGIGLIFAAGCLAQELVLVPPEKGTISGTVTNTASEPLRHATLQLTPFVPSRPSAGAPALNAATETDSQGNFTFDDVAPGRYLLVAQHAGYLDASYLNGGGRVLKIDPGQKATGIVIRLTPQSIIGGRVVDEDGEPLTDVTVKILLSSVPAELLRTVGRVREGKTDADGAFAIGGLPPGKYVVSVEAPPAPESPIKTPAPRKQQEVYVTTYYPEVTDFAAATPVDISPGAQARGLVIRLSKVPVFKVSGKVINTVTGEPGSAVLSLFRRGSGVPGLSARSVGVSAGDFSFDGIPPGEYVLETKSIGEAEERPLVAWQVISIGNGDLEHVSVDMKPGIEVRGTVIVEGKPPASWPQITVTPTEGLNYPTDIPMVDANGRFTMSGLEPAPYYVNITAIPPGMFLTERRLNGHAITGPIDLASERTASLEITISDRGGAISGTVSDSGSPVGPGITVMANGKTQGPGRAALTDENGRFSIASLPPGDCVLMAMDLGTGFIRLAPEIMEKLGKRVTVAEGSSATVELQLTTVDNLRLDLR